MTEKNKTFVSFIVTIAICVVWFLIINERANQVGSYECANCGLGLVLWLGIFLIIPISLSLCKLLLNNIYKKNPNEEKSNSNKAIKTTVLIFSAILLYFILQIVISLYTETFISQLR